MQNINELKMNVLGRQIQYSALESSMKLHHAASMVPILTKEVACENRLFCNVTSIT